MRDGPAPAEQVDERQAQHERRRDDRDQGERAEEAASPQPAPRVEEREDRPRTVVTSPTPPREPGCSAAPPEPEEELDRRSGGPSASAIAERAADRIPPRGAPPEAQQPARDGPARADDHGRPRQALVRQQEEHRGSEGPEEIGRGQAAAGVDARVEHRDDRVHDEQGHQERHPEDRGADEPAAADQTAARKSETGEMDQSDDRREGAPPRRRGGAPEPDERRHKADPRNGGEGAAATSGGTGQGEAGGRREREAHEQDEPRPAAPACAASTSPVTAGPDRPRPSRRRARSPAARRSPRRLPG